MQTTSLFRRAAALALTLVLAVSASLAGFATYDMPIQTVSDTESVYLFNLDTGKPILDQNAGQSRYIASLTKMMTALLFLESGKDLNEEITIPTSLTQEFKDIQNANGSTMNLRIGETVRRIDLLYGLLVASANDAASVIASDVSGGNLPAFVSMMNQKAQELGCTGTSFTCVHGLYDYGMSLPPKTWPRLPPPATPTRPTCRWPTPRATPCPPPTCTRTSGPLPPPTSCSTRSTPITAITSVA